MRYFSKEYYIFSLKIDFVLINSVYTDEIPPYTSSSPLLFAEYPFNGIQFSKGKMYIYNAFYVKQDFVDLFSD